MLHNKIEVATILGTIQSTLTDFGYLRKRWQTNTEEERLLGVSLTGIMDNPLMTTKNKGLEKTLAMHEANTELTVAIMEDKKMSTGAADKVESIRQQKIKRV